MSTSISLRPHFKAPALLALFGLTVAACAGSSTSPTTPTSTTASVAGTWAGTVRVTWDEMDGGGGCSGPVTVTFAQRGSSVSATLPAVSECINDPLRFEGTLIGDVLQGRIVFPAFTWPTSGQASDNHVTMTALNVFWDLRR